MVTVEGKEKPAISGLALDKAIVSPPAGAGLDIVTVATGAGTAPPTIEVGSTAKLTNLGARTRRRVDTDIPFAVALRTPRTGDATGTVLTDTSTVL